MGRNGRKFVSKIGGVYFSVAIKTKDRQEKATLYVLYIGIAVKRALKNQSIDVKLKFPNDIIYNDKKLGGILCKCKIDNGKITYVNVGVGINVNNIIDKEISNIATNLKGYRINKKRLIKDIANYFYDCIFCEDSKILINEYKNCSITIGHEVSVKCEPKIQGIAKDIDENGYLLVEEDGKLKKVSYGDVTNV